MKPFSLYPLRPPVEKVLKNVLNQGASYHLKLPVSTGPEFFLWKNIYTNGFSSGEPFLDAASSPAHIIR